jgi:cyclohexanone monooxygenase
MLITTTGKTVAEAGPAQTYAEFSRRWDEGGMQFMGAFTDVAVNVEANSVAADFVRDKIRELVTDPEVAQRLLPHDHPIGTKRLCVDTDYYRTYNSEHVHLVDLRANPILKIVPHGVQTQTGEFELDALVLATGFDAMTGALNRIDIRGRSGELLRDKWADGPRTYLGLASAGFPNLLTITGPGSPSVLSNMMVSIEQHVEWIADLLAMMRAQHLTRVEADETAENDWVNHVNEVASYTLFPTAASWYMGANIPGKTRVFMPYVGGVGAYRDKCDEVAGDGYRGFTLTGRGT